MLTLDDLLGGCGNGLRERSIQNSELGVDERGCALDLRERDDLPRLEPRARDGEVLDGALSLSRLPRTLTPALQSRLMAATGNPVRP